MNNEIYVTDKDLSERYKVGRATIWRWLKDNLDFPKPVKLSPGCTRWKMSEIEKWESKKQKQ